MRLQNALRSAAAVWSSVTLAACVSAATPPASPGAPTLGVTSTAPALAVTHWYKGTPVKSFETGKVYVIEFWATWCAPCKKAIPHLTALQQKFGDKATFIGVDVWEHPDDPTDEAIAALAKSFVDRMGDQMDYRVAGDGAANTMTATWLKPAKQDGIPATFIIDGNGAIAWIGHPDRLEPVLDQVVSGTWDAKSEKKRVDDLRQAAEYSPEGCAIADLTAARAAGDVAALRGVFDRIDANVPALATRQDVIAIRLQTLIRTDADAAVSYVQKLTAAGGPVAKSPTLTWPVLRVSAAAEPASLTAAQWTAITAVLDPVNAPGEGKFAPAYSAYAELLRRAGNRTRAVVFQQKAVDVVAGRIEEQKASTGKVAKVDADYLKAEQAKLAAMLAEQPRAAGAS